ncbi:hypothetical protein MAJ_09993, partial [Metarhizium majus ARSEF 297]
MPRPIEPSLRGNVQYQWLQSSIKLFGAMLLVFFTVAFTLAVLRLPLPRVLELLTRWGPGGAEQYEEMISVIYIIWGYFLLRAADSPFDHELFLDFSLHANVAHFSLMTAMAVLNKGDRIHLLGDVVLAWIVFCPFVYFWKIARRPE